MFKFDFSNLFQIAISDPDNSLTEVEITKKATEFQNYKDLILGREQGFLDLPYDTTELQKIKSFVAENKDRYEYIVILGIGGSMLGPQCIIDALNSPLLQPKRSLKEGLKIFTLDNVDPFKVQEITDQIKLDETLFLVQTKSGGTPETLAQYFHFRNLLSARELLIEDHMVFVTDPEKGYLRKIATQENITTFSIPENVGGRFSVLSAVGLLISEFLGLNTEQILAGAREAVDTYFKSENPNLDVFNLALSQYLLSQKGKTINVIKPYSSRLKTFSSWYVQLLSESIGKRINLDGNEVFAGITPLPALGATDQHSQLQLFKEGPNDKLILFIKIEDHQYQVPIPAPDTAEESLGYLKNQTFNNLIEAEFIGTRESLTESLRPNLTITLEQLNEKTLGGLFLIFEIATAFVGEMLKIDTFNQPGVERSKVLAKEILSKNN